MAFDYFSRLPVIQYPLDSLKTKEARDILHRIYLDPKFADLSELLKTYEVKDGDRPEIISKKLYDRSDLHSILVILNNESDPFFANLPPSSYIYQEYINNKYYDDVYYVYPTGSSAELGYTQGQSGGYIYPIFGRGFNYGEKVYAVSAAGFPEEEPRGYIKGWDAKTSSVKIDVLAGAFLAGMTIGNAFGQNQFIIGHKKAGSQALHHFEAVKDTFSGATPVVKGSIIDPIAQITLDDGGIRLLPIGLTYGNSGGITGSYNQTLSYLYARDGSVPVAFSEFVRVVTNQEYEEKLQERKRNIFVPETDVTSINTVIDTVSEILDSISTT